MKNLTLATNLKFLRNHYDYSQKYVAQKLQVKQPDYSNIEQGKTEVCAKKEKIIEALYGFPIEALKTATTDDMLELLVAKNKAKRQG
jgi:transcriptional regulator with XRE-family HTH domain